MYNLVCLNIAYAKTLENCALCCIKWHYNSLEKGYQRKHKEEYQQLTRKGRDTYSFHKLSPYYSKHVLPYYLSRAASPQVDGYVYSMHV